MPLVIFGVTSFLASFLVVKRNCLTRLVSIFQVTFMPETSNSRLPDLIEDGEKLGSGDSLWAQAEASCRGKKRRKEIC